MKALRRLQLWLLCVAWMWVLIIVASLIRRKRMSHNAGRTFSGKFRVVANPAFPAHDFFTPGRELPCRLRHGSASFMDDAMGQVRSASIKLADTLYESPFDMEMNTGFSLFYSAWNFIQFVTNRNAKNGTQYVAFYERFPGGLAAAKASIRRGASSFSQLHYYSQTPTYFIGEDGVKRYAKYRLLPEDRGPESGLPAPDQLEHIWDQGVLPGETRNRNYLQEEMVARVQEKGVTYHFQVQLREVAEGDDPEICNSNKDWDEAAYPFLDVATITLDGVLSFDESSLMRFSLAHHPPSLPLIPATSIHDYNSLNYMRVKADPAKAARLFFYKFFGMPRPIADEGPRNV